MRHLPKHYPFTGRALRALLCRLVGPLSAIVCELIAAPNVLFIAIDDLRPDLNCYAETAAEQMGGPSARLPVQTPAIDSIATEGTVFERAYCQVSICGPSRLSLMTSTYPDRTGIYGMGNSYGGDWRAYIEPRGLNLITLPQHFRAHNYTAVSYGKIYDSRLGTDLGISWDIQEDESGGYVNSQNSSNRSATESLDVADNAYRDGKNTELALDFLASHTPDKPFFLAVGFAKPHLPFNAPKQYWDLYNPSSLPLGSPSDLPNGLVFQTLSRPYKELETYTEPVTFDPIVQPTSEALTRQLVHGYLACISFVDAQIGKLIAELKARNLYEDTIIVIWGDHGFKLADFSEWAKATTLEIDNRVPLIIRLPASMSADRDSHSYSMVELVDVMPTICEAAGLPCPATAQGRSLMPILKDANESVRQTALSQYKRSGMTYTIRSEEWRYTEFRTNSGELTDRQLFNLSTTPHVETINVIDAEPQFADELAALIFDYSQTGGTGGEGLTLHLGNDNLVDDSTQSEIPGVTGNLSSEQVNNLMLDTNEASAYTSGTLSQSGPNVSFNVTVSTNRSDLRAQPNGLGATGGIGNSAIDNDFYNSQFQESVTFTLSPTAPLPEGTKLVFTGVHLAFADGEPIIINDATETAASSTIPLSTQLSTLSLKAGSSAEASFVISGLQIDLIRTQTFDDISIRRPTVSNNQLIADLEGNGSFNVWKSRSLSPALYSGPITTGLQEGTEQILDQNLTGDTAFYILLPTSETP